jgi:hypothetical protein
VLFLRSGEKSLKPFCDLDLDRIKEDASRLDHLRLKILLRRDPFLAAPTILIRHPVAVAAQAIRQILRIPRAINA